MSKATVLERDFTTSIQDDDFYERNISVLGRFYLGKKCYLPHYKDESGKIILYRPQLFQDWTNWQRILKVGKECRYLDDSVLAEYRVFMQFPEWGDGYHKITKLLSMFNETLLDMRERDKALRDSSFVVLVPKEM